MAEQAQGNLMEKIVALSKRRGFIYPSSEIYGGINGFWDYGPLGAELKRNLRDAWWRAMVHTRTDVAGLDASIIMHAKIWEASGHVESFQDPMVDCKKCKGRWRGDQLPETKCPQGGPHEFTDARPFNLMFKTHAGPIESEENKTYLRPETAQAIFVQFLNVLNTTRMKVPFGIAQIGKAFRNEINPRNFTFRSREFEQAELEFFCHVSQREKWFEHWLGERLAFHHALGFGEARLRVRPHRPDELAHYAHAAADLEFLFPFGWQEIEGIHDRGDWDLRRHSEFSGKDLTITDEETKERFHPCVIETSVGVDRTCLALLANSYQEEKLPDGETRALLRLPFAVAPVKAAVLPLAKKLAEPAQRIAKDLRRHWSVFYDESGNIGRRYRRQDEVGTPFCITYDFDSESDARVTVRERDSMVQERIPVDGLRAYLQDRLETAR